MGTFALLVLLVASAAVADVTISNVLPRRDTNGTIMDIHDGNTFYENGVYYYFGASYGLCKEPSGDNGCADLAPGACGFQTNHNVSLYTSPDLSTWTFRGHVFQMATSGVHGIMFCPKVLHNHATGKWVLWFNWVPANGDWSISNYGIATSNSAEGPYTVVTSNVTSLAYDDVGDFNLFQDKDGTGYIIYTSHITGNPIAHQMSVERLAPDYLSSLGAKANSGFFGASNVEAPAMFERDGVYYTVFGACCCYCEQGGDVVVHRATAPLGPYTTQNYISGDIPSQQTNIAKFLTPKGPAYLWQGDRWQSAPDQIKGWDFSYWQPLQFDAAGNVAAMQFTDSFTVDVSH